MTAFYEYKSGYMKAYPKTPAMSHKDFYQAWGRDYINNADMQRLFAAELKWYDCNTPEYKVCADMADAMLRTSLDIDCSRLRLPFESMVIRLEATPRARHKTILASTIPHNEANLIFIACALDYDGQSDRVNGVTLNILPGNTLEGMLFNCPATTVSGRILSESTAEMLRSRIREAVSIVVATCFFATGRDRQQRFVTQDKPANHHERRVLAKAQKCRTSEIVLPPKFTVGQDVVLPKFEPGLSPPKSTPEPTAQCAECKHPFSDHSRPNLACAVDGDPACVCEEFDTGRHLERGHIRSGHLHWYATGPRKPGPGETNDYILKWVAPTVVRPDLPLAPVKSRIIKTPANKIVSHTGDIES